MSFRSTHAARSQSGCPIGLAQEAAPLRSRDGIVALEFAIIAPVMVTMLAGLYPT